MAPTPPDAVKDPRRRLDDGLRADGSPGPRKNGASGLGTDDGRGARAGALLVVGGGSSSLASAESYDPGSGSWTATGAVIEARAEHTATLLLDGTVLVLGGALASAELYDPIRGRWTATGGMDRVR